MFRQTFSSLLKFSNSSNGILSKPLGTRHQSTDYAPKCEGLVIEPKNQVLWIKFDRPTKYNALSREMYEQISEALEKVNHDKSIKFVTLTGSGDYYSSGNDLTNFTRAMKHENGPKAGMTHARNILERFVNSLINLEKFLIAAVNGPAVGIPVTTLPLCDYVIASDKSTFHTPFTALGQCPEACSSYTLPTIMGQTRASELLMLNMTWSAQKAQNYGLVSDVVPHDKFHEHLDKLLYGKQGVVNTCYPESLKISKSLTKDRDTREKLMRVNVRECDDILARWLSEESADALKKFFNRSK